MIEPMTFLFIYALLAVVMGGFWVWSLWDL